MAKTRQARRTKAQWRALIDKQADSGINIPGYCDIHDIPVASFRRWQRKLEESKEVKSTRFIELPKTMEPEVITSATQRIELDLGNGMMLRVYS